ncbi:MAG TPA: hypothetical protein VGL92_03320 [Acidimicrobiia bacterium]
MATDELGDDHSLANRLTQVSHLNAEQALSVVQRIDDDDHESRIALLTHLERKEAGEESRLLFVTKDGNRIEARLART